MPVRSEAVLRPPARIRTRFPWLAVTALSLIVAAVSTRYFLFNPNVVPPSFPQPSGGSRRMASHAHRWRRHRSRGWPFPVSGCVSQPSSYAPSLVGPRLPCRCSGREHSRIGCSAERLRRTRVTRRLRSARGTLVLDRRNGVHTRPPTPVPQPPGMDDPELFFDLCGCDAPPLAATPGGSFWA